jgi:hypothetical protein
MQSVRDLAGTATIRSDYSREKFLAACVEAVQVIEDFFPDQYKFVGVFPTEDAIETPRLDLAVVRELMDVFIPEGETAPKLGFFQELLTDEGPDTTLIGGPLLLARQKTWVMFQALTNWVSPWTGQTKVTSGDCTVGIAYAYENFGCKYVEIYSKDATETANEPNLDAWAATLTGGTHPLSAATVPTVTTTEPDPNEIISGTFNILAQATPSGVRTITHVQFYANETLIRTDTTFPYGYAWNTALVPDGEYSIEARALDSAGEQNSAYVECFVENGAPKPYIDIREPDFDSDVSGIVNIVAWVDAINLVELVEFLVDGVVEKTSNPSAASGATYSYSWPTGNLSIGSYTITVRATDGLGATNSVSFDLYVYDVYGD